jgi:hypothetical protein
MISDQFRGEMFLVRRRGKGLEIAGPRVYHWLLRSYLLRESLMAVRKFDCMWSGYGSGLITCKVCTISVFAESLHTSREREREVQRDDDMVDV